MKVTGYVLREAIRTWQLRRDTAAGQFDSTLKKFDDETKDHPKEVMQRYRRAENAIAELQVVQTKYNLAVDVTIGPTRMTLCQAIKLIGGMGREEKMWRSVATPKADPYASSRDNVRDSTQIVAKSVMTQSEGSELAASMGKQAGALRAGIAVANATEIELDLNGDLL